MTDRLAEMFARTRAEHRPAVLPFLPAGWPELDDTVRLVEAAIEGGADGFEVGMPFSDPLGDGPVNQVAYTRAIANGCTTETVFGAVRTLRSRGVSVPLLVMGYFNTILAHGLERFVRDAVSAGVDGFIVVDLPPQEAGELEGLVRAAGLHMVYLLPPTATPDRIRLIAEHGSGFIYCVGFVGITGERAEVSSELPGLLARVREQTDLPLAVGFGISRREHVRAIGEIADGVVVGSAFVRSVAEASSEERPVVARRFLEEITGRVS
ncbi:MAG: tryptophan synthase subunit alpha [Dehalococcoidia bacterium]|nr:MAG: tryptophan synthase subunit alpha [Dehalococcoidia bacterium]